MGDWFSNDAVSFTKNFRVEFYAICEIFVHRAQREETADHDIEIAILPNFTEASQTSPNLDEVKPQVMKGWNCLNHR